MVPYFLAFSFLLLLSSAGSAQTPVSGTLVVFNAGSLAKPFSDLLRAFKTRHPDVQPAQENSGSLEAARKLTDLGKTPDVIGVADYGVIAKLLIPNHAGWYATFARNSMVLIFTDQSIAAEEINGENWWQVLQRPKVRAGRSDPVLDPNGYRSLMVFQLAERFYRQPGLTARLEQVHPPKYMRPKEADLTALVQAGELDYSWSYASIAKTTGLRYVSLPRELDLSDPELAGWYAQVSVRLPGHRRVGRDSIDFRGEPIVYALTIPNAAPNPRTAEAFVRFVFSPEGQAILQANGFTLLDKPILAGPGKPPTGLF
ncbi:MAG TPA: extracellular solute-binding protein [Gemmatimonadales bacterium]|nr:extracellular solute-binding protein [Gemmatimonadales bacterium]